MELDASDTGLSWASKKICTIVWPTDMEKLPSSQAALEEIFRKLAEIRFFKNGLKNQNFLILSYYMFLETWGRYLFRSTQLFRIRGHLRSLEVVKGRSTDATFWYPLCTLDGYFGYICLIVPSFLGTFLGSHEIWFNYLSKITWFLTPSPLKHLY